jgi:hypothetical protein
VAAGRVGCERSTRAQKREAHAGAADIRCEIRLHGIAYLVGQAGLAFVVTGAGELKPAS